MANSSSIHRPMIFCVKWETNFAIFVLSLWIRVPLFPLHFIIMRAAIWFYCSLKNGESNFFCKMDRRKPNSPLSNRWKPLVPDVLHLAISSSVKRTSTEARAAVHISVPFATIVVTSVRCASVWLWLCDTNGWSSGQQAAKVILLGPSGQETRATDFLGGFDGVYAGRNAKTPWVLYWMWLFLGKSGQWGCYWNSPEMRLLRNPMLGSPNHHQVTAKKQAPAHADGGTSVPSTA